MHVALRDLDVTRLQREVTAAGFCLGDERRMAELRLRDNQ